MYTYKADEKAGGPVVRALLNLLRGACNYHRSILGPVTQLARWKIGPRFIRGG